MITVMYAVLWGLAAATVAGITTFLIVLYTEPGPGRRNTTKLPGPGPRFGAGKAARVWRRATAAARRLPAAVTWAWVTPVKASRPVPRRGGEAPGLSAAPGSARRSPGVIHHEPGLTVEDAGTLAWLRQMRGLRHPGWTTTAVRARLAVLAAIISVSGRGTGPAGEPQPGAACLEPGPGSEGASRLTAPAPATLPTRGDAQGRDIPARAAAGTAPGAGLTGSLSPRPHKKGARAASAPPPGPTTTSPAGCQVQAAPSTRPGHQGSRLIPASDRLAAELAATDPWQTEVPFDRWLSDTFVGGMAAIQDGAR